MNDQPTSKILIEDAQSDMRMMAQVTYMTADRDFLKVVAKSLLAIAMLLQELVDDHRESQV